MNKGDGMERGDIISSCRKREKLKEERGEERDKYRRWNGRDR